jgi:hypothetical protein
MLNRYKTGLALFALIIGGAFYSPSARAEAPELPVSLSGSHFQFGMAFYPTDRYPAGANTYLIGDKGNFNADTSLVLRDRGDARAEIGIIGDNDLHFKMVTGDYGSETFTDRLLIRADSGEVDSFGTLLRQYAPTGRPAIVIGNSNLRSGAGLELVYDHERQQGEVSSVDHQNGYYTPLLLRSDGVHFLRGAKNASEVASISSEGLVETPAVISGGTTFTVSGCAAEDAVGGTGPCTAVVRLNGKKGMSAPNGWACSASNLTSAKRPVRQSSSTQTTATFKGTLALDDIISFYCMGY